jgi:sulfofructose kinase
VTTPAVLCAGAATLDIIAVVDRVPGPDARAVSAPFTRAGGGPAATAAVALARLGVPAALCGTVGDDPAGQLVRDGLAAEGVDTTWLRTDPDVATAESVVLVQRGTAARTIVTTPSARPVLPDPLPGAGWIHADQAGYPAVRAWLDAGRRGPRRGPRVSIDGGNPIPGLRLDGIALYVPTLAVLRREFAAPSVAGSFAAAMAAGAAQAAATDGAAGSLISADGRLVRVPAHPVRATSTIGAGDVFHGALLAGLVRGRTLPGAARLAAVVAALSCRDLDGRSAIPGWDEAQRVLGSRRSGEPVH